MDHYIRSGRQRAVFIVFSWSIALLTLFIMAGCSIGPVDLGGATPVPTNTPGPPTETPVPPTPTVPPRSLSGHIYDQYSGKPIAGADVTAGGVLTETTAAGLYQFDDVPKGAKLTAQASGYARVDAETGVVSTLDVKLRPNAVSGRVLDGSTGKPLAGVLVRLDLGTATTTTVTTTVGVTATVAPAATVSGTTYLSPGKVLAAPQLQAETPAAATATDSAGVALTPTIPAGPTSTPLPPTPTATPTLSVPTGPGFVAAYTADDGTYFFKDVPEHATLTFKMPGYKLMKLPVEAAAGKDVQMPTFQVHGMYITANIAASPDLYDPLIEFLMQSKFNAVVMNVQDDASAWVFDTKNHDAIAAGNTDVFLPHMANTVKALKDKGIYVIARIVTFQQKTMAEARPDWSVLSSTSGKPWKGGYSAQQRWLDASNPGAQDHLLAMTQEVLSLGFDEIQYDYVRFPSDPAPSEDGDMVFHTMPLTDTGKVKELGGFLKRAHDLINPTDAFMDIDVFGYSLWPDRDGTSMLGVIGQVLPDLLPFTDYASPMIYPSHFSPGEQGCDKPAQCAYTLVHKSGEFAQEKFAGQRAKYRPWLEDFDWPGADYTSPGTTKVADQMRACEETGCWGWMMWDPANDYEPRAVFKK